jgi:regulator of replication initiation timing
MTAELSPKIFSFMRHRLCSLLDLVIFSHPYLQKQQQKDQTVDVFDLSFYICNNFFEELSDKDYISLPKV